MQVLAPLSHILAFLHELTFSLFLQVCTQSEHDWELSFLEASKRKDAIGFARCPLLKNVKARESDHLVPGTEGNANKAL